MPSARKAVICVFDGLRPDRITAELTPHLHRFATSGTWFRESRSVFPSMTRVATTSFATGSHPQTHGIVNNAFYDARVFDDRLIDTSNFAHLSTAEAAYDGRFVQADSLGCALARAGKTFAVVHAGSAGSAYFVNHKAAANGSWTYSVHGRDATQTPYAAQEVEERYGPAPKGRTPLFEMMDHAADVFVGYILAERRPDVALIWFSEPDTAYHYREIHSNDSIAVTRRVDEHFGSILDAVASGPDADETLVVAMSDHGHLTVTGAFDLAGALRREGFVTAPALAPGVDVLASSGVAVGLTLVHGRDRLPALARILCEMPETGMLFARDAASGLGANALPFGPLGVDHPRAPDFYWLGRTSTDSSPAGIAGIGEQTADGSVPLGGGMHGGLSRAERNTLLAFGGADVPPFGAIEDGADLTDIVPTVLAKLGVTIPSSMTGRPLAAVVGADRVPGETIVIETDEGVFAQALILRRTGERDVLMHGTGRLLDGVA